MSEPHRSETTRDSLRKRAFILAAAVTAALCCPSGVRAQADQTGAPVGQALSCDTDLRGMQDRRMKLISEFNEMAKSHGGKLDPVESCPKLKTLAGVEAAFKAYMIKNKDWCNVPDEAITNVSESQAKTAALATRVCNVADQFKKQQAQQAAGGPAAGAPPKLPTGPL